MERKEGKCVSVCDIDFGLELRKAHEEGYAAGLRDAAKWVSIEEQLPKIGERVIYLANYNKMIHVGPYHSVGARGAHYFIASNMLESAKWWMPLPPMPEEE